MVVAVEGWSGWWTTPSREGTGGRRSRCCRSRRRTGESACNQARVFPHVCIEVCTYVKQVFLSTTKTCARLCDHGLPRMLSKIFSADVRDKQANKTSMGDLFFAKWRQPELGVCSHPCMHVATSVINSREGLVHVYGVTSGACTISMRKRPPHLLNPSSQHVPYVSSRRPCVRVLALDGGLLAPPLAREATTLLGSGPDGNT